MRRCIFVLVTWIYTAQSVPCVPRDFGNNGTVCVCNATYCDSTPEIQVPAIGFYVHYTSSKDGLRFSKIDGVFNQELPADSDSFQLDFGTTFQPIHGFGGSFSDAATMNIKNLSLVTQENLMRTYFTKEGSNYHFGRVPIGSTDFSIRPYTYDDYEGDVLLEKFSLAEEDLLYKIPLMKKALEINPEIKYFAAAWTAPPWMRTNNNYTGYGFLRKEYYQIYARYHEEFLNKYEDHGLKMWAISTGNEPYYGTLSMFYYNSMGWLPKEVGTWVANNLGPTIYNSTHNETLILAYDDSTSDLVSFVNETFSNELARKYISGIAIHGYTDTNLSANVLGDIRKEYPEKFLILTEYSGGSPDADTGILALGSWDRGEEYILDIIHNLQNWVTGWVDWNLALDKYGGPNWRGILGDSPIIVNPETDEFFKQPKYYAIAHFSKFIPPGSVRIGLTYGVTSINAVAFKTPKNETVIVMYNTYLTDQNVTIYDSRRGQILLELPPKSIHTIVYSALKFLVFDLKKKIFLTGPAGSSKTLTISLVKEIYNPFTENCGTLNAYIVAASTGKTAVAIEGTTIHTTLSISLVTLNALSTEKANLHRSLFRYEKVSFGRLFSICEVSLPESKFWPYVRPAMDVILTAL